MRYEIRIAGRMLEETSRMAFPELVCSYLPAQTVLSGEVTDEAHLYGLLHRIQSLGLRVTDMHELPVPGTSGLPSEQGRAP
jgi:hypothetical protein